MIDAKLAEYQITRDGHGVEACGIDAATYQNPVGAEQGSRPGDPGADGRRDHNSALPVEAGPLFG